MKRRFLSVVLALALMLGLAAPGAQAAGSTWTKAAAVGQARGAGLYEISYRSEYRQTDGACSFYYSDALFDHSAMQYDHSLAKATLCLAMSAFNTWNSDRYYWMDGKVGREDNLAAAFETLGFSNAQFYHYDISQNTAEDYVAYGIAQKTLPGADGRPRTLIALMLRGGGYGSEWTGNFKVGEGASHEGLVNVLPDVLSTLQAYLAQAARQQELGTVQLWISGYSRAGAVANLLAARIAQEMPQIRPEDTFVYTFAAPAAVSAQSDPALLLDYDHNHAADGTLKSRWDASNVFNIISSADIVARILPESWGFHRNGNDRFLPAVRVEEEIPVLNETLEKLGLEGLNFGSLAASEDTDLLVQILVDSCSSKSQFAEKYQDALMDMIQCVFTCSEKEVRGELLSDAEIVQRVLSLGHMGQFSRWKIIQSVWAASSMSRPVLEKLGDNVPLQVQQMVVPLLAVGLCYGLEQDALQVITRYIVSLVPVRGRMDQALQTALCHFPETYYVLMEHYDPLTHHMQPYTRYTG
ncbi:MAG: lipase [Faecalibacterium sp.]